MRPFAVVNETETPLPQVSPADIAKAKAEHEQAMKVLQFSIATIGKRFITALSNLFTAAALLSAWLLWRSVLPSPTVTQLVGLALYAVFILTTEWVRRKG
jgi:hypothetical protein